MKAELCKATGVSVRAAGWGPRMCENLKAPKFRSVVTTYRTVYYDISGLFSSSETFR